jgi:hypothetical protein
VTNERQHYLFRVSALAFIGYAAAKFLAYCAWCAVGLHIAGEHISRRAVLRLGSIRWCIGLAFGIIIYFAAGSIESSQTASRYFAIYTPTRVVEWAIIAALIHGRLTRTAMSRRKLALMLGLWCIGGIGVSFATDLLSPDGLQGRFCVGRCLC